MFGRATATHTEDRVKNLEARHTKKSGISKLRTVKFFLAKEKCYKIVIAIIVYES